MKFVIGFNFTNYNILLSIEIMGLTEIEKSFPRGGQKPAISLPKKGKFSVSINLLTLVSQEGMILLY